MRLMLFNRSLGAGGAERQLVTTACAMQARGMPVAVTVLYGGPLRAELDACGVEVFDLGKSGRWDMAVFVRLVRTLRLWRPDALYCFGGMMLFAALVRPWIRRVALVWGIRASVMNFAFYDRISRMLMWLDPLLARAADLVICNSNAGRDHVLSRGFPADKVKVVWNGINTERWRFDPEGRARQRQRWGVSPTATLVGIVGRLDPIKDHVTFLKAAALCHSRCPEVYFVVIGDGPPAYAGQLRAALAALAPGLPEDRVIWAGDCGRDMAAAYSALDLVTLTSLAEGFPNVLAEAMSCGLPAVSTDVGDARVILGPLGRVVPVGDAAAVAEAICATLAAFEAAGTAAPVAAIHDHIVGSFGIDALLAQTTALTKNALVTIRRRNS